MKIEISKEEFREIIRLNLIGIMYEKSVIDEDKHRKNDDEIFKDQLNLLIKLLDKADDNIEMNFIDESMDALKELNPKTIEILIESRKRTYTSKYWNFLDGIIPS